MILFSNLEYESVVPSGIAFFLDGVGFLFAGFGFVRQQITFAEWVAVSVGFHARQIARLFDVDGQGSTTRRNPALADVTLGGDEENG